MKISILPFQRQVVVLFWLGAVFSYFFQFPLSGLSNLIIPFMAFFIVSVIFLEGRMITEKYWIKGYVIFLAYLMLMVVVSVIKNVSLSVIIRFFLILALIPIFCIVEIEHFETENAIFVFLACSKCILLLYIAFLVLRSGSYVEYRQWAKMEGFGDIYINPYTRLPCVQVHGNGILPVAFILNNENKIIPQKRRISVGIVLLLGIIVAGNAAFVLGISIYLSWLLFQKVLDRDRSRINRLFNFLCLILGIILFGWYAINQLAIKSSWSNAIRIEQAKVLLNNNLIIGNGLGSWIETNNGIRTYAGDIYFELQSLYIFNQIGFIGLFLFYFLVLSQIRRKGWKVVFLFFIYLVYTFWNPYCFDSTEMIVVLLLHNSVFLVDKANQ